MSSFLKFLLNPRFKILEKCDSHVLLLKESNLVCNIKSLICSQFYESKKLFHLHAPRMKESKSRLIKVDVLATRKRESIAEGEHFVEVDQTIDSAILPTFDLPEKLFDGIPFKNVPVVHVKATKRNTIMTLSDHGKVKVSHSSGKAGFKNCKKGTGIAAQAAGTFFGAKALKQGFKTVRVVVKGLGNGRLSALKGLQLGGVNIISLTDITKDIMTHRPKKQRRL